MKILKTLIITIITGGSLVLAQTRASWEIAGDMLVPVYGGQAVSIDSLIYIFGGYSDSLQKPLNLVQVYDPAENSWKTTADLLEPRYGFILCQIDKYRLFAIGGNQYNIRDQVSAELRNFSNVSGPVETASRDSSLNRIYATGHILGQNLYIIGGLSAVRSSDAPARPFIMIYDISNGLISGGPDSLASKDYFVYHHTSVVYDSVIYIFGGVRYGVTSSIYACDLRTGVVEPIARMTGLRAGAASVLIGDAIIILGGYSESARSLNSVEFFVPAENSSYTAPAMNYGRKEPMATVHDGFLYVFGGKDRGGNTVTAVERIQLRTEATRVSAAATRNFQLLSNYPNPFNPGTTISFTIPGPGVVRLDIFNITGEYIRALVDKRLPAGAHKIYWDGKNEAGRDVPSGIYFCRIINQNQSHQRKLVLVR